MTDSADNPVASNFWFGLCCAVIATSVLWSIRGSLHPFSGDTANSRSATVYSLAHHGTWEIGDPALENPFELGTIDKVRVDGKMYSSKPPLMPLLMTGEYILIRQLFGLNFDQEIDRVAIARIFTITFISIPFLFSALALWSILRYVALKPSVQTMGLIAFLWGTEYAGYASTINNHVPATACLTIGYWGYITQAGKKGGVANFIALLLGIVLGLAITIDLPSAIFVLIMLVGYVTRFEKVPVLYGVIGFLLPIAVHSGIMMSLTGSLMPFQLNHDSYMYEESYWRNPVGIDALNHPWGLYLFNMTFGRVGMFILYPILFLGLIATAITAIRNKSQDRIWSIGVLSAIVILATYYVTSTNNYGGASFGFRWLIITTPFLIVPAAKFANEIRSRVLVGICVALLAISIVSAAQCRMNTWSVDSEWPTKLYGSLK